MQIDPNVAGGDMPLSSLSPGDCLDGVDGAPAVLTQGISDGSANLWIVSLGNGAATPLEPSHLVRPRPDLTVSRQGGTPTPSPAPAGPAAQRAGVGQAMRVQAQPKR